LAQDLPAGLAPVSREDCKLQHIGALSSANQQTFGKRVLKLDSPQILLQTLQATDQSTLVLLSSYLAKWTAIVVALIQGAKVVFAIHPA
jgi:hypothetical protein